MNKITVLCGALLMAALSVGCAAQEKTPMPAPEPMVEGTLFYRERMALPDNVLVSMQLYNSETRALVNTELTEKTGQIPMPFAIKAPVPGSYLLNAAVFAGSEILFATPEPVAVSTQNAQNILLVRGSSAIQYPLEGTYWKLLSVNGSLSQVYDNQPEPYFTLNGNEVSGSDGCNNFFMTANIASEKITFGQGGSTMMLCPQGQEQSREMLNALSHANTWIINGSVLELLKNGKPVATFEASPK